MTIGTGGGGGAEVALGVALGPVDIVPLGSELAADVVTAAGVALVVAAGVVVAAAVVVTGAAGVSVSVSVAATAAVAAGVADTVAAGVGSYTEDLQDSYHDYLRVTYLHLFASQPTVVY